MLQVKNKIRSGKSVQVFPAGREANTSSCGEKIEPDKIISGATLCNRTRPCGTAPESGSTVAGEPTIIIHENGGDDTGQVISSYLRSSGIVHRAMRLFEEWNYHPARISSSKIPVDILAIRKETVLLVQVISSRATVLDAASMTGQYGEKIQHLREMGTSRQFRKILLAYSATCGWKYYDVLPGGLIPAWDLPEAPVR